ncbi:indolepyruvate ferredoxin oxidoreductase subunit alpha [Paenalcaligenes sp.]|uniref:indolepyruvate ferredoxin oxidoreductase subunit alpha n=1 Tax=Paenalcaligenes sp. TaxID=1966342 RepID=UPI002607E736|nr:indolepyruvate ferredoxin oxidoreductase subunit alpha [Paenalcaligenes sp.]
MAERSFVEEVKKLRLGDGEVFSGEGILAVTKALLESGVSYVAGYQGAPISHLMDVLADAQDILTDYGIRFENSASEATAAASLAASVNYPLRGAVTFKATVGTNVASDALANLASGGVKGGALIIVGEDYGEGSSIMQERSHAFAMKSQIWMLDPRPNLPCIVQAVKDGFDLSEASNTPVMLQLRIRACHVHGQFVASDNKRAKFSLKEAMEQPERDIDRIVLPPASFLHEKEKIEQRWPAAIRFIEERQLNEFFGDDNEDIGLIVQGGGYNSVIRALEHLGLADVFGESKIPLYVMNVAYPLIDSELIKFCEGKRAVLVLEEGQPNFVEQNITAILNRHKCQTELHGKDFLPMAGEYNTQTMLKGIRAFLEHYGRIEPLPAPKPTVVPRVEDNKRKVEVSDLSQAVEAAEVKPMGSLDENVHARPPGFCTGCPERPIFTAMKLVERELGEHHVSADIGCHLFSILPPFNLGNTTMGYGLGGAGAAALNTDQSEKRAISIMGDGGFWHNGLTSGIANAVFNQSDNLTIVVDNSYTAATGGQDILSSKAQNPTRSTGHLIEKAARGVGVKWLRTIKRTYDLKAMTESLREALTTKTKGPKVIIAQSECMLNRQRRERGQVRKAIAAGERVVRERFGVDPDTCTGDHSCIRLSGCPSLSIRPNPDALRTDPVATVMNSCVGCGLCGEVSHAAILCPSFYRAQIISNPTGMDKFREKLRRGIIGWFQRRSAAKREQYAF